MSLPPGVRGLVGRLAPTEFAEDLADDLADGYERRRSEGGRARLWLCGELVRTPWVRMWRQARRMRAAGTRREMPARPGGGIDMGRIGTALRVAARALRNRPSFTLVATLTLAAGIGAATLIFSVIEGVMLRPLPYDGSERVYRVYATNEEWREAEQELLRDSWDRLDVAEDLLDAVRGRIPGVESLGAYNEATLRLDDGLPPTQVEGAQILPGFFETLPLEPLVGRLPTTDELERREPVVVLSERLWVSRYGRDPEVLGRSVSIGQRALTVVGVLPGSFAVPSELSRWWAPLPPDFAGGRTDAAIFAGLARLQAGVMPETVTESIRGVGAALAEENPRYAGMGVRLRPFAEIVVSDVREGITMLFWAVVVVVLIACVNLANLVVARASRRRGELAMRAALGASRAELVWAMLTETALVCALGCGMGILVATRLLRPFLALLSRATPDFPRLDDVSVNTTVLGFSVAVALLTVVLAGLFPALSASRRSPWEALQQGRRSRGGRATRRTQRTLLMVESTLAMVLLVLAGLLTRSALYVASVDPGYASESVAYVSVETTGERYDSAVAADALGSALEARLRRLPGAIAVARASNLPGLGGADGKLLWPSGGTQDDAQLIWATAVSPGYFGAMGIPLVAGRDFSAEDGAGGTPAAIVSELLARRYFGDDDPVGRTLVMGTGTHMEGGKVVSDGERELAVVGVVGDVRQLALVREPDPGLYLPIAQTSGGNPSLVVRARGEPVAILEAARAEVSAEDAGLLVTDANVLHASMRRLLAPMEVRFVLVLSLAALAAFLTVVGIYGVVAYVVSDQIHEIGIRMALGAKALGESSRMVRGALRPVGFGALLGIGGAYVASRILDFELFGVEPLDPATYASVLALLLGVAAAAAWLPARRAAAVDPVEVLTDE